MGGIPFFFVWDGDEVLFSYCIFFTVTHLKTRPQKLNIKGKNHILKHFSKRPHYLM